MVAPNQVRAGSIFMELSLNNTAFQRGLNEAQAKLQSFAASAAKAGAQLAAVGSAFSAPFVVAAETTRSFGDALDKMSQRTGITVENLSKLSFAAEQSGQTLGEFEKTIVGLSRQIFNLERGELRAVQSFGLLGVQFEDIKDLSPNQVFAKLADGIASIENPLVRAGRAQAIFGRSGRNLLPLLARGSEGIAKLGEEAENFGLVVGTDTATAAADLTDAFNEVQRAFRGVLVVVGRELLAPLADFSRVILTVVINVQRLASSFPQLVPILAGVGVAITAVGGTLLGLSAAAIGINFIIGGLSTAFGLLVTGLLPIAAVVGAAVLVLAQFGVTMDTVRQSVTNALDFLGDRFGGLFDRVKQVISLIANAVRAGEIELATRLLWEAVLVAWQTGQLRVVRAFDSFQLAVRGVFDTLSQYLVTVTSAVVNNLLVFWEGWKGGITRAVNVVAGEFQKLWDGIRRGAEVVIRVLTGQWEGLGAFVENQKVEAEAFAKEVDRITEQVNDATRTRTAKLQQQIDTDVEAFNEAVKDIFEGRAQDRADAAAQRRQRIEDSLAASKVRLAQLEQEASAIRIDSEKKAADALTDTGATFDEFSSGIKKAASVGVRSTFEGQLAPLIFGGGTAKTLDNIEKNTEETARSAEQLFQELRDLEAFAFK